MPEVLWIALPFVAALGSGILSFIVAQARMDAAKSRDREALVEARERLAQLEKAGNEKLRAVEADTRRQAFDEFLADVRIEERHYLREIDAGNERRKCLVLQERVCFRNIPLSQWIERELPYEKQLASERPKVLPAPVVLNAVPPRRRLLR